MSSFFANCAVLHFHGRHDCDGAIVGCFGGVLKLMWSSWFNEPRCELDWLNSEISRHTWSISHSAPFRTKMWKSLFWMVYCGIWKYGAGALWDMWDWSGCGQLCNSGAVNLLFKVVLRLQWNCNKSTKDTFDKVCLNTNRNLLAILCRPQCVKLLIKTTTISMFNAISNTYSGAYPCTRNWRLVCNHANNEHPCLRWN